MNWLKNQRMAVKFLIAPLVVLLLLMVMAAYSVFNQSQSQAVVDDLYNSRFAHSNSVQEVSKKLFNALAMTYQLLASANANMPPEALAKIETVVTGSLSQAEQILGKLMTSGKLTDDERSLLASANSLLAGYKKQTLGVIDVAKIDYASAVMFVAQAQSSFDKLAVTINELVVLEDKLSSEAFLATEAGAARNRMLLVIVAVVSVLAAIVITLLVQKATVESVKAIQGGAESLRDGDLRRRVEVSGHDEVGLAAGAFNTLIDSFQSAVREVLAEAQHVSDASRTIGSHSEKVQHGAESQAEATSALAATVEQFSVSIQSISESAELVRGTSQRSLEGSREGVNSLEKLRDEFGRVKSAFDAINASVINFVLSAKSISSLTREVKDIADQTNLLALNAAIEAARAGEMGRGFAVVADEVRKLAEKSSLTAGDIDKVTSSLEQQSKTVDTALTNGNSSLSSGHDFLLRVSQVLGETQRTISEASRGVGDISSAVNEQSRASHDIARNLEKIATMTENTSHTVAESAAAADQLAESAQALERAVGRFSV